ncbi:hypothetical protein D3C87_1756090 [compost metagenome]
MGAADPRQAAGGRGALQPAAAGNQGHFAEGSVSDAEKARARRPDFAAGLSDGAAHGRIFPDAARAHADRHGCGTGPLGGGQHGRGAGGAEGL